MRSFRGSPSMSATSAAGRATSSCTDNRAVTAADFTPYSVTAPTNFPGATIPLPDGRGRPHDRGVLRRESRTSSDRSTTTSRSPRKFGGSVCRSGMAWTSPSTRALRTVSCCRAAWRPESQATDNCEIRAALPEIAPTNPYCHVEQPFQTQVKFLDDIPRPAHRRAGWQRHSRTTLARSSARQLLVPAANISGSVARCRAAPNGYYNLLDPNSLYGERVTQLDLRMSKIFRIGHDAALAQLRPGESAEPERHPGRDDHLRCRPGRHRTAILDPRLFKFGVQFDF